MDLLLLLICLHYLATYDRQNKALYTYATAPHPRRNAYWGYFSSLSCHFFLIDMLSILIATLDMRKGILSGTAKLETTHKMHNYTDHIPTQTLINIRGLDSLHGHSSFDNLKRRRLELLK